MRAFIIFTLGLLSTLTLAVENDNSSELPPQQKYNLTKLFHHIESQIPVEPKNDHYEVHKLFQQRPHALTELLKKEPQNAWNDVVAYFAKNDFILSALISFRHLSSNDLLNRLTMEKDTWKEHVLVIGDLLEKFGGNLVSDPRFGSSLQNLISCHFQVTTFASLKSLAQALQTVKRSDSKVKDAIHDAQEIIKNYLEEHKLLEIK